jgi:drug/metabolite transporter (DMT)-like permease
MSTRSRVHAGPALYALTAALLFGASTPAAKLVLGELNPQFTAGLLYLGSGLGLAVYLLVGSYFRPSQQRVSVKRTELFWLAGAVACGGVAGPLLLMFGLTTTQASSASLLLNLEGVFTALLAWFAFKEHTDRRIVLGMIAIVLGSIVLSWAPGQKFTLSLGAIAIIAACLCWALDNNLTRKISQADPVQIATIKGLVAGCVNCGIAIGLGSKLPSIQVSVTAAMIGLFGYGISLTLFIKSLRLLGTARTGAYFSTAPFAGAVLSLVFLHEQISINLVIAGALMSLGVMLHLTEKHDHEHEHPAAEHEHLHIHDEHHAHSHAPEFLDSEPHSHPHSHSQIKHSHPHFPDEEHGHAH